MNRVLHARAALRALNTCSLLSRTHIQTPSISFSGNLLSQFSTNISKEEPKNEKRRLDVAIVGAPNAGKSQFVNMVTKTTISAVSRKRHTTRNGVLATHTRDNAQLVFIDTPGFVQCRSQKDEGVLRDLVKGARAGMDRADFSLIVIDAAKKIDDFMKEELAILMVAAHNSRGRVEDVTLDENGELIEVLNGSNVDPRDKREKFAIVLNKVDLVNPKEKLLDIAEEIGMLGDACVRYKGESFENEEDLVAACEKNEELSAEEEAVLENQFPPVFYISALKDEGVDELVDYLHTHATPTKDFVLPPNQKSAQSMAERVEEIIREKCYRCLHREVPHNISQVNRVLKKGRMKDGRVALRVDQTLIVKTKSHYRLVMGKSGMTLRRIQETAKRDLLKILQSEGYDEVILSLNVKLRKSNDHDRDIESERQGIMGMVLD